MPAKRTRAEVDEYVVPAPAAPTSGSQLTSTQRHTQYEMADTSSRTFRVKSLVTVHRDQIPLAMDRDLPDLMQIDDDSDDGFSDNGIDHDGSDAAEDQVHELEVAGLGDIVSPVIVRPRAKRQAHTDNPLAAWTPCIDEYVDEFLRLEARASQDECAQCENSVTSSFEGFRCIDCLDPRLFCSECIVCSHSDSGLPLHHIQNWNGTYFASVSLKALGLRVQLGHPDRSSCSNPESAFNNDFTVIDSDGIHPISLDYCGCQQAAPKRVQLLRARLFPSTIVDPKTAATFRVLETFQMLSFTSKVSAFEYYRSLARRTDNTGTSPPPDRYHAFLRIVREWRHVRLLKRMGRGYSESGVQGTQPGELAVLCPACPMPGINMPENWKQTTPESEQWLYSLFVGIDANFRLKRMNVSSEERDPGLNKGYAYVVETKKFNRYLEEYDSRIPEDKSTCHNHDAIKLASMRGGKGTAATGLATAECSRHDMKRPTAVGDLQKGERYVNVDYIFLSSLERNPPPSLVISYDIACQWSVKLLERCNIYPPNAVSTSPGLQMRYLVPKFHLPAHVPKVDFSFNLSPRVGRTDGEAPERGWSDANGVASSTKEMGPGSRRDTLDDHFGDRNWAKIAKFGETFVRKCEEAIAGREEYVNAFVEFDAALPEESTKAWTQLCQAWEADPRQPNPFQRPKSTISDANIRLLLAQEDAEAIAKGSRELVHENVSPSMLIYQGLEFEGIQQHLARDASELGPHSTSLQHAKILERSNSLRRRIEAWIDIQHLYFPFIAILRARADQQGGGKPVSVQNIELHLPSSLVGKLVLPKDILQTEWRLRLTHAEETLNDLRGLLLLRSMMQKSKDEHMRGQRQQTRSRGILNGVEERIRAAAAKYRRIREALTQLAIPLQERSWENLFLPLDPADIVGLTSMEDTDKNTVRKNLGTNKSEGRKKLSWIWKVHGLDLSEDERTNIALRIEWCRARARAHRWQEECLLLNEEMRRVLAFFKWQAEDWAQKAFNLESVPLTSTISEDILADADIASRKPTWEGKIAFAYRQVSIRRRMLAHFTSRWNGWPDKLLYLENGNARVCVERH